MRSHTDFSGARVVLMTLAELQIFNPTGYRIELYDPSRHCDNKCLRAGGCMTGRCTDEVELIETFCACGGSLVELAGGACLPCLMRTRINPLPKLTLTLSTPSAREDAISRYTGLIRKARGVP